MKISDKELLRLLPVEPRLVSTPQLRLKLGYVNEEVTRRRLNRLELEGRIFQLRGKTGAGYWFRTRNTGVAK